MIIWRDNNEQSLWELLVPSPGIEPGLPEGKPGILDHQGLEARSKMALWFSLIWKQDYFKKAKAVKTHAKFIIRDTAPCVGAHTGKECIYHNQKQGRNTHPERKGMGILCNEEEYNKEGM